MNNIEELLDIIRSNGGAATSDTIVRIYCSNHRMLYQQSYKRIVESTLRDYPLLTTYDSTTGLFCIPNHTETRTTELSEETYSEDDGQEFFRGVVRKWANANIQKGALTGLLSSKKTFRQTIITPTMASIVPIIPGDKAVDGSGYYCVYEIDIRPLKATVRLMATVTSETPVQIIDIYKSKILPSIGKTYREDGRFYNKTFGSFKFSPDMEEAAIVDFMDKMLTAILDYESKLSSN